MALELKSHLRHGSRYPVRPSGHLLDALLGGRVMDGASGRRQRLDGRAWTRNVTPEVLRVAAESEAPCG